MYISDMAVNIYSQKHQLRLKETMKVIIRSIKFIIIFKIHNRFITVILYTHRYKVIQIMGFTNHI